jgi:hypothetical protein
MFEVKVHSFTDVNRKDCIYVLVLPFSLRVKQWNALFLVRPTLGTSETIRPCNKQGNNMV